MKSSYKTLLLMSIFTLFVSGCSQKVQIKALNPAEIGEMASKKRVAISNFKRDRQGLSGKIESKIANFKLNNKKYFTVLNRKNLNKIIAEQKLQSSELMDETTATKVGKLVGAQAIINGEIASATATRDRYSQDIRKCLKWTKDGCKKYEYYRITCKTVQASVSANINIVNVQTGSIIYGDTITKEYNGDSCRQGNILSKGQALNRLTSQIASEFVYKLTPNYIYFNVALLDEIELKNVTNQQEEAFENSLAYIKAGRMEKSEKILQQLLDELDGKSYVVSYVFGVVNEAQGKYDKAKKLYTMADDLAHKPVKEINLALIRINNLITKQREVKRQIDAK